MNGKGMPRADFVMGLILMAFSIFIIVDAAQMPSFEKDWGGVYAAPGFVPILFGIAIFGMSMAMWIRALKNNGHRIRITREKLDLFARSGAVHRWCLVMLYAFGYFFLVGRLSFYILTFVFLFGFMLTFGKRKWLQALIVSAVTSATIFLVFTRIFLVPLP